MEEEEERDARGTEPSDEDPEALEAPEAPEEAKEAEVAKEAGDMRMSIRLCECEGAGEPSCLGSSSAAPSPSLPSLPSPSDGLRRDCIGDVGAEEVKELLQEEEASEAEEEEEAPQAIEGAAGDAANGDGGGRLMPRPGRLPSSMFWTLLLGG